MTFEELGAALCAERERRGLSLDDVAAHLKISTRLIQALESGDLSALPHPAYTKGFLRAYASYMALDPEAVAEVAHALQPAAATECTVMGGDEDLRSNPAILRHGARQGLAGWLRVFILLILVVALAGGGWMLWQRGVFKDLTGSKEQGLPTAEPAAVAPAPEPVAPAPSATTPAVPAPTGGQTAPAPQGNGGAAAPAGGVAPVP
ncbi:helix-turn-helix domain-containing protein, partial [Desulfovibrio sp.]